MAGRAMLRGGMACGMRHAAASVGAITRSAPAVWRAALGFPITTPALAGSPGELLPLPKGTSGEYAAIQPCAAA